MRLWTGVCVVAGLALGGCDAPPQVMLERAGLAQAAAPGEEAPKDCGCDSEACPEAAQDNAAGAAPAEPVIYRRVNVEGAPTAMLARGELREADPRTREEPMHAHARAAAMAALAAGDQGRYWELHKRLFANRQALDAASLEKHAQELGLDVNRFKLSLADPAHEARIQQDLAEASALGIRGTPAFYINGRQLLGARPAATFKQALEEELVRAERLVASGVSRSQVYARLMDQVK
ncbi:MAG: DsbA family protein [Myxococcota bacterium]|nr:DsbA family protein [Myxococcota bacterium]